MKWRPGLSPALLLKSETSKIKWSSGRVFLSVERVFRRLSWTLELIRCLDNIRGLRIFFNGTVKWRHWRAPFYFLILRWNILYAPNSSETGQVKSSSFRGQWFSKYLFSCFENCRNNVLANLLMGRSNFFNVLQVIQSIQIILFLPNI